MIRPLQSFTFVFLFLIFPGKLFCQDIIYHKNAAKLNVRVLDADSLTVVYSAGDAPDGTRYYLSRAAVDSIVYEDGRRLGGVGNVSHEYIRRNYAGVEFLNLLSGKLNFELERISKKGTMSFSAGLLINTGAHKVWTESWQFATYSPYIFHIRTGINFYPFNYSLEKGSITRFSTGFCLLAGAGRIWDTSRYDLSYEAVPKASLMWNFRERFFIGKNMQAWVGGEISVLPVLTFLCPQAGLMIGFR